MALVSQSATARLSAFARMFDALAALRPGDGGLAARTRRQLRTAMGTIPPTVRIEVWNGHVTLRGELPSQQQIDAASAALAKVRDMRRFDNFVRLA